MAFPPDAIEKLTLDTGPWFSCDDCFEYMDTYVETTLGGPADDPLMDRLRRHLLGCPACAEDVESLLSLVTMDRGHDPGKPIVGPGAPHPPSSSMPAG